MVRHSHVAGLYGAKGTSGGRAISDRLDQLAGGIKSGADTERGLSARINALTRSERGIEAMEAAGIDVTQRTLMRWLAEEQEPSRANRLRIEAAYQAYNRERVSDRLRAQLTNDGRGTRIEIHAVDQTGVEIPRQRDLGTRDITISADKWDDMIDAWEAGDDEALDAMWDGVCDDLGSEGGAYANVAAVGF